MEIAFIAGNKTRNRPQNFRGPACTQHFGQQSYNISSSLTSPYDTRRHDMYALPQHHLDSSATWTPHQPAVITATNSSGTYIPQYASTVYTTMPYHEVVPPHCTSDANMYYSGNFSWNPNYMSPMPYLPSHVESTIENAAISSYPHTYPMTESYSPINSPTGYQQTTNQSLVYPQPMIYPQPMQYHALPPPSLPSPHIQEQWNSCMAQQSYVQYTAPSPQTIAEPSSSAQNLHNSL